MVLVATVTVAAAGGVPVLADVRFRVRPLTAPVTVLLLLVTARPSMVSDASTAIPLTAPELEAEGLLPIGWVPSISSPAIPLTVRSEPAPVLLELITSRDAPVLSVTMLAEIPLLACAELMASRVLCKVALAGIVTS
ncbi:hypothetical protein D3C81_1413760 [compost metagenome]